MLHCFPIKQQQSTSVKIVDGVDMTKEEAEKEFPIGSLVKVINNMGQEWLEIGLEAKVIGYDQWYWDGKVYLNVKWITRTTYEEKGWSPWRFAPLSSGTGASVPTEQVCPRCNGRLAEKKVNASLFSDEVTTVKKCERCGWC